MTKSNRESRKNTVSALPTAWTTIRDDLRSRHRALEAHRELRRELVTYTTKSAIDDLDATLDRFDNDDVAEIRNILHRNQATAA